MEVDRCCDVELVVAAVGWRAVASPLDERDAVTEPANFELAKGDFGNQPHLDRHERQIFADVPAAAS